MPRRPSGREQRRPSSGRQRRQSGSEQRSATASEPGQGGAGQGATEQSRTEQGSGGHGERGEAGPAPTEETIAPFDTSGGAAVSVELLRLWENEAEGEESMDARFWFMLGKFRSKAAADKAQERAEQQAADPARQAQMAEVERAAKEKAKAAAAAAKEKAAANKQQARPPLVFPITQMLINQG